MRIWRDLPSRQTLERFVAGNRANLIKHSHFLKKSTYSYDPTTIQLFNLVEQYHGIKKDRLADFPNRQVALKRIENLCDRMIRDSNLVKQGHHIMQNSGAMLGSYVHALKRRAAAKGDYIKILKEYYQNAGQGEIGNPMDLITRATAAQSRVGKTIGLAPGSRLEGMDPAHRPWEFWLEEGQIMGPLEMHLSLMKQWFAEVSAGRYNEPLFVFLENTEHCLDQDVAKQTGIVLFRTSSDPAPFYMIRPVNTTLYMGKMTSVNLDAIIWDFFDTTWVTRRISQKGSRTVVPSLAYNWTAGKELICGVHNAGEEGYYENKKYIDVHHSSFTGGQMVRCAGMIGAANGKITYLDDDSGHYRPGHEDLYRLVKHCDKRGYFSSDAVIRDLSLKNTLAAEHEGLPVKIYLKNPMATSRTAWVSSVKPTAL